MDAETRLKELERMVRVLEYNISLCVLEQQANKERLEQLDKGLKVFSDQLLQATELIIAVNRRVPDTGGNSV